MLAGDGEVPAPVVCLEASLAVTAGRQLSSYEDMNAGPRGAYLGIGVELLDNRPGPRLYLTSHWIEATIQVYAAQIVLRREHEPDAVVAVRLADAYGLLVARPGFRVCALGFLTRARVIRYFRRLAVALLDAPAQPLSTVPYVECVCYHRYVPELGGEHRNAPRLARSLRTASPRNHRL